MTAAKGPGFKKRRPKAVKPEAPAEQYRPHVWKTDEETDHLVCRVCDKMIDMQILRNMDTRDERLEAMGGPCDG